MAFSNVTANILSSVLALFFTRSNRKQQNEFQRDVQAQIDAGLGVNEAALTVAMEMIDTDPNFKEAKALLDDMYTNLPAEAKAEYDSILGDLGQVGSKFSQDLDAIGEEFTARTDKVMGLLEDQGQQALKDISRTFGEAKGKAAVDLAQSGLAGGGVGASVGAGFATKEADALARSREATALAKANTLAGLEGQRLGFLGSAAGMEAGFGQVMADARMAALAEANNLKLGTGQGLADFLYGQGQAKADTFGHFADQRLDFIEGITQVPPDTSGAGRVVGSMFRNWA